MAQEAHSATTGKSLDLDEMPAGWNFPADLTEAAWGIIANAGGGDWTKETPEWQKAATRWRDAYHETLPGSEQVDLGELQRWRLFGQTLLEIWPDIPNRHSESLQFLRERAAELRAARPLRDLLAACMYFTDADEAGGCLFCGRDRPADHAHCLGCGLAQDWAGTADPSNVRGQHTADCMPANGIATYDQARGGL